ncbi:MAG: sigma-54 dependent transcriptional regulator [Planctomycetaceae bacterium]|nr:sigma-54 dependent transcriptional regulator [Planctomycetaceae bacterium]
MRELNSDVELTGSSESMQGVRRFIERISGTDSAVVILGETGTGKELVARSIHARSLRSDKSFIAVNCGALPENLIESELFGHRRGSFTGADAARAGLLEVADGGTLFLDEIGELSKGMQAKLLRFLENGEVRRIGDNVPIHCDVRVICATLRNLEAMVLSGEFREDLWFRINTFIIRLPSLRERMDDLPELICVLVKRFRKALKSDIVDIVEDDLVDVFDIFTKRAFKRLTEYDWPGNIRQLANTLEYALVLSDKLPIDVDALPDLLELRNISDATTSTTTSAATSVTTSTISTAATDATKNVISIRDRNAELRPEVCKDATMDSSVNLKPITQKKQQNEDNLENTGLPPSLRELESQAISQALQRNEGNKVKAAEELGISLKTLYNKINLTDKK